MAAALLLAAPQAAVAASSPSMRSLEQQIGYVVGSSNDVGVAAIDLKTGEMVSVRGDQRFPMASTVKVAIAANYLSQVEHGRRSLNDMIGGQSAARLMDAMLIHSNNVATDMLLRNLGGPSAIQAWLNQHQVKGMRMDRTIAALLAARRDLWDVRDSTTPEAMVQFLRRLDSGDFISPSSRAYLLGVMSRCETGKNRMKAFLPYGTKVEHKTGTLNGLTGDVGFITMPDGRRVALAIFARNGNNRPRTIAATALAIYEGFRSIVSQPFGGLSAASIAAPVAATAQ
ncbi:serine hydrolase [Sphingomonas ginkgonis]|uniref:Beta-lactamase n=1 Tax=Sphingomonas ginkgonis TaxID=2315330 RepID=A0A3R9Y4P2_9SPHN|nr:serine hydrolase [Sphingomonas ginkgonis]RST30101.1 serine hydrolase [Sphingomonas ginkgonis]